ncbi:MAG: DUF3592 domain-containing protein [Acidobacteria bacterium]|nr:DUF3592 domain-containing protein [Acidobacteriota bacterium]
MTKEFFFKPIGTLGFILTLNGFICTFIGIIIDSSNLVFLSLGLTTFGVGILLVALRMADLKQKQWLLNSGIKTSGTITYLAENKVARVNRQYPWLIQYQYQVNSDSLQGNDIIMDLPKDYTVGKAIEVLYSPNNPKINRIKIN